MIHLGQLLYVAQWNLAMYINVHTIVCFENICFDKGQILKSNPIIIITGTTSKFWKGLPVEDLFYPIKQEWKTFHSPIILHTCMP